MRGNSLTMCQGRFRLDITTKSFTERVFRPWNKLSSKVVELLSLEISQRCLDVALEDMV